MEIDMRISSKANYWLLLLLLPLTIGLGGCNTVAGVGEDLEAAGGELEESAERRQSY
jgi:predicted small secreted protein